MENAQEAEVVLRKPCDVPVYSPLSSSAGNGFLDPKWLRLGSTRAWTE